jgi:hypothetical protein
MQTMTRWTDDRMDDLSAKVDETNRRVDELNREMHAGFRAVRGEIKSLQTTMLGGFVGMSAAMITGFAALFSQV